MRYAIWFLLRLLCLHIDKYGAGKARKNHETILLITMSYD